MSLNVHVQKVLGIEEILTVCKIHRAHQEVVSECGVKESNVGKTKVQMKMTHTETRKIIFS